MRKALLTIAIVFTIAMTSSAMAQTPYFQVYFDQGMQMSAMNCPPEPLMSVMDTLYVVAHNFDMYMSAAEFTITYPSQLFWIDDTVIGDALTIGSSPLGIGIAWTLPINAFGPTVIMTARVFWNCNNCAGVTGDGWPILIEPYPLESSPRAIRWPDEVIIDGVGMTALICPQVPVEESTWGQIKALYQD